MPTIMVSTGISMYFEDSGDGDPIVYVSGQNTDHTQWRTATPYFRDYRTIVLDNRGTGATDKPADPYSLPGFADDAAALLDALNIERAHFIGASMGGKITQWMMINHPDRVTSAVLLATTPGGERATDWEHEVAAVMKSAPTGDASDPIVPLLVSESWAAANPEFAHELAARRVNPGGVVPRRLHFQASAAHDAWRELASVTTPTLILHGADDRLCPLQNAELLQERIPGSQLVTIPGGRHEFFVEFPKETFEVVRLFLSEHSLSTR